MEKTKPKKNQLKVFSFVSFILLNRLKMQTTMGFSCLFLPTESNQSYEIQLMNRTSKILPSTQFKMMSYCVNECKEY